MLPHGSVTSQVTTTRSASSFTNSLPDIRGLKKTQIAGTVFTRFAAPSLRGSNRPIETPPSSPRGGAPHAPAALLFSPKRIDPVTPTENDFQFLPENGNAKFFSVTSWPLSGWPKSASQFSGTFSTRYPAPAAVNRRGRSPKSKSFCCPSAPSSNSKRINFPVTEALPMGLPGASQSCARRVCDGSKSTKQEISSVRNTRELSRVTAPPQLQDAPHV